MNAPVTTSYRQDTSGQMAYPLKWSINWILFKTPVFWWRLGLAPLLWRSMLLLTTRGRKSHLPRHTMLSYTLHKGKAYLISGWGSVSDWYLNLSADPQVTVQLGRQPYTAAARRVVDVDEYRAVMQVMLHTGGDSHFQPWLKSLDIAYDLDDLTAKRERVYLIALDPVDRPGPPALGSDLNWIWTVLLVGAVCWWLARRRKHSAWPG